MRTIRTLGLTLLFGALLSAPAAAQLCNVTGAGPVTCTVNATTSLTIPVILRMTIGSATTNFGTLSSTDYDNGRKTQAGPSVTVKANQSWNVQVASSATFWTAGGGARANKPLSDLLWGTSSGGSFSPVSATGAQFGTGTGTGGTVAPIYFQSLWDYAMDSPGTYSVAVTFTLVSP